MTRLIAKGSVQWWCDGCGKRITFGDYSTGVSSFRVNGRSVDTHCNDHCHRLVHQITDEQLALEFDGVNA